MRVIDGTNQQTRTAVDELEARLDHGDRLIRQLEAQGESVETLERHWLKLLREYEIAWIEQQDEVAA